MRNLRTYLTTGALALTAGCMTPDSTPQGRIDTRITQRDRIERYTSMDNLKGAGLGEYNLRNKRFNLEASIINGEGYFVSRHLTPINTEDGKPLAELPFVVYRESETSRVVDPITQDVQLSPEKVIILELWKDEKGEPRKEAEFESEGPYGIKARVPEVNSEGVRNGVLRTSQRDYNLHIATGIIDGMEFYTPKRGKNEFAAIMRDRAKTKISPEGEVTLVTDSGIYIFREMSISDYTTLINQRQKERIDALEKSRAEEAEKAKKAEEEKQAKKQEKILLLQQQKAEEERKRNNRGEIKNPQTNPLPAQ